MRTPSEPARRTRCQAACGAGGARGYSTAALDRALGLLVLAVYVVTIIGLAGLVTYGVIRLFPTKDRPDKPDKPSDDGTPVGRLFRRAKRAATS
jgi:hypothetical protein